MTTDAMRKRFAEVMLGVDSATITEVVPVLSRNPVINGVVATGIRWSGIVMATGERLGYSEATPGALYVLTSASH